MTITYGSVPRHTSRACTLGGYAPGGLRQAPPVCRMIRPRPLECAGPGESSPNRIPAFGGRKPEGATQRRNKRLGGFPGESSRIGFLHLAEGSRGRKAGSTSELLFLGMRRVCAGHRSTKPLPATILARQGLSNSYLRPLETKRI